jgi:hypothetical protein
MTLVQSQIIHHKRRPRQSRPFQILMSCLEQLDYFVPSNLGLPAEFRE